MIVVRVCVVVTGIGRAHNSRHMLTHHADVPAALAARRRGCRLPMHVVFLFLHVKTLFFDVVLPRLRPENRGGERLH